MMFGICFPLFWDGERGIGGERWNNIGPELTIDEAGW